MTKRALITLASLAGLACSGGERDPTSPPPGPPSPALATVLVTTGVAVADQDLATSLGWTGGIPAASVNLLRNGTDTWVTASTDAAGVATYFDVLPGLYRVWAERTLSAAEAASAGQPIRAFGDGRTVEVRGGDFSIDLALLADRTGTLVISEIGNWIAPVGETGNAAYREAMYFEVYNNSSQTIFLDGKTFGASFFANETAPTSCAQNQFAREDPAGVYTRRVIQFPGDGSQHPIAPGEAKVIPIAAIDHTAIHPDLFDLSSAAFEIRGASTADNPAVPDMLDVGLSPFVVSLSGISTSPLSGQKWAFFIADSFEPTSLPILYRDGVGNGWVRVPAATLIDVMVLARLWPDQDRDFPTCVPVVHSDFERYEGGFRTIGTGAFIERRSPQRRVLRIDGHQILQNVNTSAVDFFLGVPTPGTVPAS